MSQNIVESQTATYQVVPGEVYVFAVDGTWDSITGTLGWVGAGTVTIQAFTADGTVQFTANKPVITFVTGADGTNAGALTISLYKKISWEDPDIYPNGIEVEAAIA